MTLIACTLNHNIPFIVGDLLISSNSAKKSVQLPTNITDINKYLIPNNAYAIGLHQKIYIVKKNVCVALAGSIYEMQLFLKELKQRCSYWDDVQENHIRSFIREYDFKNLFSESAFFIMLMQHEEEHSVNVKQFWYPYDKWDFVASDIFEGAYACGTGKDEFLYNISEEIKFQASAEKGEIRRAISSNIGLIARLLATERVSLNTINKLWGGGFETIFYDGYSFVKFDEITYIVNEGEFDETGDIGVPIPRLVLHYKYHHDLLLISSIEILKYDRQDCDGVITITSKDYKANLFIVPQIDDLTEKSKTKLPIDFSFQTNRIAVGYAISTKNNSIFTPSFFSEKNNVSVIFKYNESIQINLSSEFNDMVRSGAKDIFPKL